MLTKRVARGRQAVTRRGWFWQRNHLDIAVHISDFIRETVDVDAKNESLWLSQRNEVVVVCDDDFVRCERSKNPAGESSVNCRQRHRRGTRRCRCL